MYSSVVRVFRLHLQRKVLWLQNTHGLTPADVKGLAPAHLADIASTHATYTVLPVGEYLIDSHCGISMARFRDGVAVLLC